MLKYQNNIKKTWNVIKDAKGKTKTTQSSFPKKIMYKMKTITDVHLFAKHFKPYFTEIGPNLANKIGKSMNFEGYIKKCSSIQPEHPLSINKLKNAFFLLDIIKVQVLMVLVSWPSEIALVPFISHCFMYLIYL